MKYKIERYPYNLLSRIDAINISQRFYSQKKLSLRSKYHQTCIRNAYVLFANSVILKEAHYYIYVKIQEYCNFNKEFTILDLGIGEGFMWQKVLRHFKTKPGRKLNIIGIDYSETALRQLKKNIQDTIYCAVYPIKSNLTKLDMNLLPRLPDMVIACLSLHHLRYKDKIKIINRISMLGIKHLLIIDVDYNLEQIDNINLRNIFASLLYRDVFDTIRVFNDKNTTQEILNNFYYDEYLNIIKSNKLSLEEKYISLSAWSDIIHRSGMKIKDMQILFSGVNNIYKIGAIEGFLSGSDS